MHELTSDLEGLGDNGAPLRIVVADDHALVRGGMALLIKMVEENVEIIEANDFSQAIECLSQNESVDLMLLDLLMPGMDGTKGIERICRDWPDVPVVVVSVNEETRAIRQAISAGAMGYIPKTSSPGITMSAIKLVLSGGVYIPPHVLRTTTDEGTVNSGLGPAAQNGADDKASRFGLTRRQVEVLDLIAIGKSNKAIAAELGLTTGTVKMHISRIFKVLKVENRTEAVARFSALKT